MKRYVAILLCGFLCVPRLAFADCASPTGIEGAIVYNSTHKVVQFCNGSQWISAGSSTDLSNLNASNLTSGTVPTARLGTGTANNTTFLRGDGTWQAVPSGADNLGNHTATQALNMNSQAISGATSITASGEITGTLGSGFGQFRATSGNYGAIFRNDGTDTYVLLTDSGSPNGGWNSLRPLRINNATGNISFASNTVNIAHATGVISGNGSGLTALNASNLASGTVPTARLGSGTANSSVFLRGDGTWAAPTAGDAPTLDGLDSAQFLRSDADDSTSGRIFSTGGLPASQVMATATGSLGAFEARAQGSAGTAGAAFMTFHRPGSYAGYFGLDTDNQWKVGGWSMGANAYKVWHQGNDGTGSGLDADTVDGLDSAALKDNLGAGGTTTGNIVLNNTSPTITLQDTDHRSGFVHMNSNTFYVLNGSGNNSTSWATVGSQWPFQINLATDDITIGGAVHLQEGNLNLGSQAVTSNAGTVIDGSGGWHRTYGNTGWYNGTYGGGWNMEDTTWLRAYGGKWVYTPGVVRADAGIRTNQVCDINGGNCVAQTSLGGGGGGGITANTTATGSGYWSSSATCPAGYFRSGCSANFYTFDDGTYLQAKPSGAQACFCEANYSHECVAYCVK